MKTLYAFLPCYNEADNIRPLSLKWLAERDKLRRRGYVLEIVAIDDKSTDHTGDMLFALAQELPDFTALTHKVNGGLGAALSTAIRYFLTNGKEDDLCAFMDGDNTHDPEYIHALIKKIEDGVDCAIASRYEKGADIHGVPGHRAFLSDCAKVYYTMMLHVPNVKDYTCGYRVYTYPCLARAWEHFGDGLVTKRSFSCMMELLYKLHCTGAGFGEVPFILRYDHKQGASKMQVFKTIGDSLVTAAALRLKYHRP